MTQALPDEPASEDAPVRVHPDPTKIIVPRRHGQVLIEPALKVLEGAVARGGGEKAFAGATFGGVAVEGLRATAQREMLEAARVWAERTGMEGPAEDTLGRPWVVTGHQVEFYHAGVWAKVVAADALATRTGAVAFDLLVDHDVVDERGFDVPVQEGEGWKRVAVTWGEASAVPAEGLTAPEPEVFEAWDARVAEHPEVATDALALMMAALKPGDEGVGYTPWMSGARARLEAVMGVEVHHVPTSALCEGEAWRGFVRAWAENAAGWVGVYNKHLGAYRERQGIKNVQHPMPDLACADGGSELPFWIYRVGEARERLVIRAGEGGAIVKLHGREWTLEECLRGESGLVVRPRALALTMFARLFLADLFIHGIGGALYDQITDGILEELVGVVPSYACVSAAWLLPLGQPLEGQEDVGALKWRRHHLKHNPQLAIDPFTALKTEVAELIVERRGLVERMRASLAGARRDAGARRERARAFRRLHAVNAALHGMAPRVLENLDRQLREVEKAREENKVLLWREYFFALHTMESLRRLMGAVGQ